MRLTLTLLLALAGIANSETIDLGNLDQYITDLDTPDHVYADALWVGDTEDGYHLGLGEDIQTKAREAWGSCGEASPECYQKVRDVLYEAYVHYDGVSEPPTRKTRVRSVEKRFIVPAIQAVGALAALLIAAWTGDRLSHEDDFKLVEFPKAKIGEFESLNSEEVTVMAGGEPVLTIPPTPTETTSLQGSESPQASVAEDGSIDIDLGDDSCGRLPQLVHKTSGCRRGENGTVGEALCGAEAVVRNTAPGAMFNDLLLLDTSDLNLGVKKSAGLAYDASLSLMGFVDGFAPHMNLAEEDAEQLAMVILAASLEAVDNGNDLCEGLPIDTNTFVSDATDGGDTGGGTGNTDDCPQPLVCGLPGEDCPLTFAAEEDDEPTVCGEGDYEGCPCQGPPYSWLNEVPSDIQALMASIAGQDSEDADTSPRCDGDDGVTEIPSDVFSSEEHKVHGLFCESWEAGEQSSLTVDSRGRTNDQRLLRGRAPPGDPDDYVGFTFELKYQPADDSSECDMECNEAFRTLGRACRSSGGQNQMNKAGEWAVKKCGTFGFEIIAPDPDDSEDDEDNEEDEGGEDEGVDHTDRYDPEAYEGISLKRSDWECKYFEVNVLGNTNHWCRCTGGCDDESCWDMPVISQKSEYWGCVRSEGDDRCSACEPWRYACIHRCDKNKWSDCPQCHALD